uniref:deoxyribose-phosphate aldolase n=1 Tax=Meloidogyne incognita TaxID=6306 RepID=A0A914L9I3_MELIC
MNSSDYSKNYELLLEELKADDVLLEIPQVLKEEIIEESKRLSKIRSEIERLITFIDLTTLMGDDTKSRVDDLVNSAISPVKQNLQIKCASVCVYPARVVTGKETINATLESAYIMCSAIAQFYKNTNKNVGFKAAGCIRSVEQALQYMILFKRILGRNNLDPKLFRIGASMGLLENIREKLLVDKLI